MLQNKPKLAHHTNTVHEFLTAVNRCTLPHVPQATRRLIETGHWRERFEFGRVIKFDDFVTFITADTGKAGCGLNLDKVTELLRKAEDEETLQMWLQAIRAKEARELNAKAPDLKAPHRPKKPDTNEKDVRVSEYGNDPSYALARLRRDAPEIHARVLTGEIIAQAWLRQASAKSGRRKRNPTSS
jgi:hypothetical protein